MDLGLKGKVALVTGAGSPVGFGRAISLALAREACDIIAVDKNEDDAQKAANEVKELGRVAIACKADVTRSAEVNEAVATALKRFGRIDILVNNAGATPPIKPFLEQDEADWDRSIAVNLKGAMICAKAVLPNMVGRKYGKIINISSGGAYLCSPYGESYVAAKAGIIAFTKCLGLEFIGSGINVNAIAPGWAMTNLGIEHTPISVKKERAKGIIAGIPIGRATTPEDIANTVVFLASEVSGDIVGKTLSVDGGAT
jgi:NAD(P)-dependent dehydrogenase (short-subunit alcohol dehydrogenase family)